MPPAAAAFVPEVGFCVSVDGCSRLKRALPHAALSSISPPAAFYQDSPTVEGVKVTLDYELSACLSSPRWTDGYQYFRNIPYDAALCVIIDVR